MRVVEVPVAYHPRIAGTASKLRAFRDGLRIVRTIVYLKAERETTMFAQSFLGEKH